jgi:hypothetical protein
MTKSENWFKDRIGKRIYRDATTCKCHTCNDIVENGMIIHDEFHADYIAEWDALYKMDGVDLRYRDKK